MDKFKVFKFDDGFEYKFNRILILSASIILLSLLIFVLVKDNFKGNTHYYSYCPITETRGCFNAFYKSNMCLYGGELPSDSLFCTVEHLSPGQHIGEKPPWYITYFNSIGFSLLFITLLINNFMYNKEFIKYAFGKSKE
jgi:hypothetical protein